MKKSKIKFPFINTKSIATKVKALFIIVLLISTFSLMIYNYFIIDKIINDNYTKQVITGTDLLLDELLDEMNDVDNLTELDHTHLVDLLKHATGLEFTVFEDDIRVFSTIEVNGERVIGTTLSPDIADIVINQGLPYIGDADILGVTHLCSYTPYFSSEGEVIGVLFAGISKADLNAQLSSSLTFNGLIGLLIISIAIILLSIFVKKNITKPLNEVVLASEQIKSGNFNVKLNKINDDEIGHLVDSFNEMNNNLTAINEDMINILSKNAAGDWRATPKGNDVYVGNWSELRLSMIKMIDLVNKALSQVAISSDKISVDAASVADGAQSLAQGATQQAQSIEELAHTIENLSNDIKLTANDSKNAKIANEKSQQSLELGNTQMQEMIAAMKDIDQKSQDISKIIKVIDEIAFQTNILSLNAAVEAASAGQAGKGFAVVADEVRNLATKTAQSASETASLIKETVTVVSKGNDITVKTMDSINQVYDNAKILSELVDNIATTSAQQESSANNITIALEQISSVVQMNSATSEESAAASIELSDESKNMKNLVNRFDLK